MNRTASQMEVQVKENCIKILDQWSWSLLDLVNPTEKLKSFNKCYHEELNHLKEFKPKEEEKESVAETPETPSQPQPEPVNEENKGYIIPKDIPEEKPILVSKLKENIEVIEAKDRVDEIKANIIEATTHVNQKSTENRAVVVDEIKFNTNHGRTDYYNDIFGLNDNESDNESY